MLSSERPWGYYRLAIWCRDSGPVSGRFRTVGVVPVDRRYPPLRIAMWEAHEMQCCYGPHPLRYGEMQIDHVVPEAILNDPGKWAKVKVELGLPDTFDGQNLENFLPSCGPCNRVKTGTPFEGLAALLPLRRAKNKKAAIQRRIRALEREARETTLDVLIDLRRRFDQQDQDS